MILQSFRNLFQIPELRTKILYTAFFLIIFRLGSYIPIPGIDLDTLKEIIQKEGGNLENILILFSTLTGGALANCAIFSLGIMPYISASIIFSLLVKVVPSLEALSKEGPSGYKKINEYTRYATVPLCIIQSYMIVRLFRNWGTGAGSVNLFLDSSLSFEILAVVTLTAGAMFLMWLGEQINEFGIGNGISILIMAGIVARMPHQVIDSITKGEGGTDIKKFVFLAILFVAVIAAVIYMTYGQRKIAVQQAKHTKGRRVYGGQKHFLPLKVNQSGVMPVIFASSLMVFPIMIASIITGLRRGDEEAWFSWGSFWYIFIYILFIYFFSYFWTSLMFQPGEMSNQLKEYGSFIPGIRPGKKTAEYLEKVMIHITFVGAAFLSVIALIPQMVILGLDIKSQAMGAFISNMGGTSILIVVGVILDVVQKLESHLLVRNYDGFVKKGRIRGRR